MTGYLSHVSEAVNIPANINCSGAHDCFGYRVLEGSFGNLKDMFDTINEHCGITPLTCPVLTPPPSPGRELSPLPLPSPTPAAHPFFTGGDYISSDEELMLVIARIQHEEEENLAAMSPSGPSVRTVNYPSPLADPSISRHLPCDPNQPNGLGGPLQMPARLMTPFVPPGPLLTIFGLRIHRGGG